MNEIQSAKRGQIFFDDVVVGSEITPAVRGPYMVMDSAKFQAMTGDFYPTHYDHKWATEKDRIAGVVIPGLHIATHLSQVLTDWIGPDGALKRFANRLRAPTFVGDTVTMTGKVTGKYIKDGENRVECELWGVQQDGTVVIEGSATVKLPASR